VFIFDDRPFNARITFEGTVEFRTPNNQRGRFTHYEYSSTSSASFVNRVLHAVLVWIPNVSSGVETVRILTAARRVTGTLHPTPSPFTKSFSVMQNNLIRPNDHVTLHLVGREVSTLSFHMTWTARLR